jgi:hypothetical protein
MLGLSFNLFGAGITLVWDANTEPDVAGYRLYYGYGTNVSQFTTNNLAKFNVIVNTGNVTNYSLTNLSGGRLYGFYVTCYNTSGLESLPSNIVTYQFPMSSVKGFDILRVLP